MLTSPYNSYVSYKLRPEFKEPACPHHIPLDFGSLDAPICMPAGSHYAYKPVTRGLNEWVMPSSFDRE